VYVWWDTGVRRPKILVVLLEEVLDFMTRTFLHKKISKATLLQCLLTSTDVNMKIKSKRTTAINENDLGASHTNLACDVMHILCYHLSAANEATNEKPRSGGIGVGSQCQVLSRKER
jgi:hypothetical protein